VINGGDKQTGNWGGILTKWGGKRATIRMYSMSGRMSKRAGAQKRREALMILRVKKKTERNKTDSTSKKKNRKK
jgi:hypothetical protein